MFAKEAGGIIRAGVFIRINTVVIELNIWLLGKKDEPIFCVKFLHTKWRVPRTCTVNNTASTRSRKPAEGQIICQRTDYLSSYRFTDLLKDRLSL